MAEPRAAIFRPPRLTRGADATACVVIVIAYVAAAFIVGLHPQAPVIDDWLYAGSVRDLLDTGRLRIGEISAVYPVLQILWGALSSIVFGFSFGVLRTSTVCLSAAGCVALYATLREVGRSPSVSLLAALTVTVSPTFFLLSHSFMTDAPFVSVSQMALYGLVSGLERDAPWRWRIGAALSVAAFLVRPVAVALPMAAAVGIWRARRLNTTWLVPVALSAVAMVALQFALPHILGSLDMEQTRTVNLRYVFLVSPGAYANWNAHILVEAAFPMLPLVAGALAFRRGALRIAGASTALALALWLVAGELPMPLNDNETWSMRDMAARTLVACQNSPHAPWSARVAPLLPVCGLIVAAGLLVGAWSTRASSSRLHGSGAILLAFTGAQFVVLNALWLYNDRYYTAFAPTLAYVATAIGPIRVRVAAPFVALLALVAITGTRDTLAFNDTVAATVAHLEHSGIPPADIDAGWASNGWRLYMRPEQLPPGADRRTDVPFVTSTAASMYVVSNCAQPGYDVIQTVPLPAATWQGTDRLLVLRRTAARQRGMP